MASAQIHERKGDSTYCGTPAPDPTSTDDPTKVTCKSCIRFRGKEARRSGSAARPEAPARRRRRGQTVAEFQHAQEEPQTTSVAVAEHPVRMREIETSASINLRAVNGLPPQINAGAADETISGLSDAIAVLQAAQEIIRRVAATA